jgi:hypothetical protein
VDGNSLKIILHLVWFGATVLAFCAPLLLALILRRLFKPVTFLKYIGWFLLAVSFEVVCAAIRALSIPLSQITVTYELLGIFGRVGEVVITGVVINSLLLIGGNGHGESGET